VLKGVAWHGVVRSAKRGRTMLRSTRRAARSENAQHGVGGGGRRWDGQREGVHSVLPWASVHPPDTVQGTSSQQGGRATEIQSSPARSTAPELNGGECVSSSGRGVALSSKEAPGPTHEEEGGVRWLDTDSVAGTEARHGGGGLPETDKRSWLRQDAMGGASFYSRAPRGAMRARRGS
jgi:hypothetical protein